MARPTLISQPPIGSVHRKVDVERLQNSPPRWPQQVKPSINTHCPSHGSPHQIHQCSASIPWCIITASRMWQGKPTCLQLASKWCFRSGVFAVVLSSSSTCPHCYKVAISNAREQEGLLKWEECKMFYQVTIAESHRGGSQSEEVRLTSTPQLRKIRTRALKPMLLSGRAERITHGVPKEAARVSDLGRIPLHLSVGVNCVTENAS